MMLIKHNRDKTGDFQCRVLLHIPVGFAIGFLFPLSYPLLRTILDYEANEDLHTSDEAWKDLYGVMVGEFLGHISQVAFWILFFLR